MLSFIICSIDAKRFAAVSAMYKALLGNEPYEIIAIHDASSLAEGYLRGIAASKGEIVIFSHDDVEVVSPDFVGRLKAHLSNYDVVGVLGTSRLIDGYWPAAGPPHLFGQVVHIYKGPRILVDIFGAPRPVVGNIQALDGLFIAVRRAVLSNVTFDATTFDGFHQYDIDFTYAAYAAGLKLAVACDINIVHQSAGDFGPVFQTYADRFHRKWFPNAARPAARKFSWTAIEAISKADALAILSPPYWNSTASG
jgi:GT2 family glycosyltransferase